MPLNHNSSADSCGKSLIHYPFWAVLKDSAFRSLDQCKSIDLFCVILLKHMQLHRSVPALYIPIRRKFKFIDSFDCMK